MAALPLVPHPDNPPRSSFTVHARARRRTPLELSVTFRIAGSTPRIAWHEPAREGCVDELWKHSCFEAFIRAGGRDDYVELNLAPARQWALYDLDSYRGGRRHSADAMLQDVNFRSREDLSVPMSRMRATLTLPPSFADLAWTLGLTTIIEELDGTTSYWALAHAPGLPDFHNPDTFIARLPAPDA